MPIYEYQCLMCEHIFEILVFPGRVKKANNVCPKCGDREIWMIPSMIGLAIHNKEMITPRDGYKVRNKVKKEEENGQKTKEKP